MSHQMAGKVASLLLLGLPLVMLFGVGIAFCRRRATQGTGIGIIGAALALTVVFVVACCVEWS